MDADVDELTGAGHRRRWLTIVISLPFLAVMAAGVWFLFHRRALAHERTLVDQVTGAAFGCVASVRGDAPETWSLERSLEHMSRMERVTRDVGDESAATERPRFAQLASDAATGCEQLGVLMRQAREDAPHLYFAVPAKLAQPPDREDPEGWYRRVLPQSRAEVLDLTRQIRAMASAINARRSERALMVAELPIEGHAATELARILELAPIPRELERREAHAWPLENGVFVLRRGSLARVPCDTRHVNPLSCFSEFAQVVGWDGALGPQRALERPEGVSYWSGFTPTMDGSLFAVGASPRGEGIVGRYPPGETAPELAAVGAPVDAEARLIAVVGGVALFPSDGSAWWTRTGALAFVAVEITPPPILHQADRGEAGRGVRIEGRGTLSLFGTEEDGWTSRLSPPSGVDVLLQAIDAHRRVRAIASLRALGSGKAVALLQRFEEGPDALILTTDFGRSWVSTGAAP